MPTIAQLIASAFLILLYYSCNGQSQSNEICRKKFKTARDLTYSGFTRQSALDSALHLTNECLKCDSMRKEVVDFKVKLLVYKKKYAEGIIFIDSLSKSDFTFQYKQNFLSKGLQALKYEAEKDTIKRDLMYKEMVNDLEQYVNNRDIGNKEFNEIYTDMFVIKEKYLDADQINKEVEALEKIYPEKKSFFDFFRK